MEGLRVQRDSYVIRNQIQCQGKHWIFGGTEDNIV